MKRLLPLVAALAMVLLFAAPASAVQFGSPDTDNVYNGVGIEMSYPGYGNYVYLCTVTLIDKDSVLTAGHCTWGYDGPGAWTVVGFEQHYDYLFPSQGPGSLYATGIAGTPVPHPNYDDFAEFPQTYDVGVINLAKPAPHGVPTWPIAAPGTLDPLVNSRGTQDVTFDVTGYGVQDALPPSYQDDFARYLGTVKLNNLTSANNDDSNIQYSANPGNGGGTCFGDSGGPLLYGGEIVAVNSFVLNNQCMGNGFAFRVDSQEIQDWIISATTKGK